MRKMGGFQIAGSERIGMQKSRALVWFFRKIKSFQSDWGRFGNLWNCYFGWTEFCPGYMSKTLYERHLLNSSITLVLFLRFLVVTTKGIRNIMQVKLLIYLLAINLWCNSNHVISPNLVVSNGIMFRYEVNKM